MSAVRALVSALLLCAAPFAVAADRPNILVILADDLGWSDLGAFGGEIRTPHLDALAARGLAMTQFYVAPTCSPTRSMLLTGVDHHRAGVGTMAGIQAPNQREAIGYGAQLHDGVVTAAEALAAMGYYTVLSGKWHLALEEAQYPHRRGFDRSFTLLEGGASHFADRLELHRNLPPTYLEDGVPAALPDDFYSSRHYVSKLLEYLKDRPKEQPYFAYLAFTAPHDPIQVPDDWLDRYQGRYDAGPVAMRAQRVERLRSLGLIPAGGAPWQPMEFPSWLPMHQPPWAERIDAARARDARTMELYAAMVEYLDAQVGRVLSELEARGDLDNTLVLFFSDNGAAGGTPLFYPHMNRDWFRSQRNNELESLGRPGSHVFIGAEWASVAGGPLRLFKTSVAEGGIRSPLLVAGPGIAPQGYVDTPAHVTDLTATFYDLAQLSVEDHPLFVEKLRPAGRSLLPLWRDQAELEAEPYGFELFGSEALRRGAYKALRILPPLGDGSWSLYDLSVDPGETKDLRESQPELLAQLVSDYATYAQQQGVIAPEPRAVPDLGNLYAGPCDWWCEVRLTVAGWIALLR